MDDKIFKAIVSVIRGEGDECEEDCTPPTYGTYWGYKKDKYKFCEQLFFQAVKNGCGDVIEKILNHGVDVNLKDSNGSTALHKAISNNDVKVVRVLLERGAEVEGKQKEYPPYSPLALAAVKGQLDIVRLLLDFGATFEDKSQLLCCAVEGGNLQVVEIFLDLGIDVNFNVFRSIAVIENKEKIIALFEGRGLCACISQTANDGKTFLHLAAECSYDVIELMLDLGDNIVNKRDNENNTALHIALNCNKYRSSYTIKRIQLLIERGADIKLTGSNGKTCLHLASRHDNDYFAQYFLNAGFDINHLDDNGETCLFDAVKHGSPKIVKFLLDQGADINIENIHEKNILDVCLVREEGSPRYYNRFDIAKILVMQVAQIKFEKKFISEKILSTISNNYSLSRSYEESQRMKSTLFDGLTLSVYDLFQVTSQPQFMMLARIKSVRKVLESHDFRFKHFRDYGDAIDKRFRKGMFIDKQFERTQSFFNFLSTRKEEKLPKLPDSCIHQIFGYLKNRDTGALLSAFTGKDLYECYDYESYYC